MRFSLSSRASVASRCFLLTRSRTWRRDKCVSIFRGKTLPPANSIQFLQRGVNAVESSMPLVVSAASNSGEVFSEHDLSLAAVHKFPQEVFRCTKNNVWSFAVLHPSPNNRTTELQTRGVLCCFYEILHLCAYLESRKILWYGGVQRPKYINV